MPEHSIKAVISSHLLIYLIQFWMFGTKILTHNTFKYTNMVKTWCPYFLGRFLVELFPALCCNYCLMCVVLWLSTSFSAHLCSKGSVCFLCSCVPALISLHTCLASASLQAEHTGCKSSVCFCSWTPALSVGLHNHSTLLVVTKKIKWQMGLNCNSLSQFLIF